MFNYSEKSCSCLEYRGWRKGKCALKILQFHVIQKLPKNPPFKLPSLESRSDVNVWSSPGRFFKRKENNKINTIKKAVLDSALFQAVGISEMEGRPSEVRMAALEA